MSTWNPPPGQPGQPYGGYAVPGSFGLPAPLPEPLISANYAGEWNRGVMIVKRGWRPLVALQAAGLGLTIAAAVVGGVIGAIAEVAARAAIVDDTGIIIGSTISTMIAAVLSGIAAVLIAPLTLTAYADMRVNVEPVTSASIAQELGIAVPGAPPYPYGGYAYR